MAIETVSNNQAWSDFLSVARMAQERNPVLAARVRMEQKSPGAVSPQAAPRRVETAPAQKALLGTRFDAYA